MTPILDNIDNIFEQHAKENRKTLFNAMKPYLDAQEKRQKEIASAFLAEQSDFVNLAQDAIAGFTENVNIRKAIEEALPPPSNLNLVIARALEDLEKVREKNELDAWHNLYLGKNSIYKDAISTVGDIGKEHRARFGKMFNDLGKVLRDNHRERKTLIGQQYLAKDLEEGEIDITLPAHPRKMGGLHPSTRTHREFQSIWADMGFQVYQSFDVEEDEL